MKKIAKLKMCNWSLLFIAVAILISGLQLEVTHCSCVTSVWVHIVVGLLFVCVTAYHIFLHFSYCNWFSKFHKAKSPVTRVLWWVTLITLITGLVAMVHWLSTFSHATIGGVHGKLGFLMILLSSGHVIKRIKFFRRK